MWVLVCLRRLRASLVMSGLALCCLLYVLMFVALPPSVHTISRQEVADAYSHITRKAAQELGALKTLAPVRMLSRVKALLGRKEVEDEPDQCAESLGVLLAELRAEQLWALRMIDASSKLPSGLLNGNLMDLGDYDECVAISVDEGTLHFDGQHCLVAMDLIFKTLPAVASPGVLAALGNSLAYTFSLCLPSTCSPSTLSHSLAKVAEDINYFTSADNLTIQFVVQDTDCHTRLRPSLNPLEVVGITVTLGFLVLVVISTILDVTLMYGRKTDPPKDTPKCIKILVAFSCYTNGKRLLDTSTSEGTIQVLHSIKFLSIAWVAIGHRIKFSIEAPLINLLKLADYIENWSSMIILNATLSVDVFFVISGILNTYIYMNVSQRGSKGVFGHLFAYVHRYIRLTPAYALMILITVTWLYRTGDGPLWDRLVGDARSDCESFWWSGLLYINNYYNPNNSCMMQSWYLAADMQLFWLSPLVLYPLWRWPRVGLVKLALLVVLSIIVPFVVAYVDLIKTPIPITFDNQRVHREMDELYLPTHTKTVSYVIGILAGYLLHMIRSNRVTFRISAVTNVVLWVLAVVSMIGAVFGGYHIFQLNSEYNRLESSLYIGFYRFFWSIGIAWFILACTTGHGGFINTVFSWRAFMPLGRLTYCIYLTHVAVILYGIGSMRQPQHFSYYEMIQKFLGEFVVATVLALILSLVIESPIMILEKVLLFRNRVSPFPPHQRRGSVRADLDTKRIGSIDLPRVITTAQLTTRSET